VGLTSAHIVPSRMGDSDGRLECRSEELLKYRSHLGVMRHTRVGMLEIKLLLSCYASFEFADMI
jgi:hypothetical protein